MDENADAERDEKVFTDFIEGMESWARGLGLYLQHAQGRRHPLEAMALTGTDPVVRPFVGAVFMLGEEAFSERVQHPEKYTDETMLKGMEHATLDAEAERIAQRFLETGKLFDGDDDEDE